MKKHILTTFCLLAVLWGDAQNLVQNPSLETFTQCPFGPGELFQAPPWRQPTDSGTSDYFNVCNVPFIPGFPAIVGVPQNTLGNQNARTGNAYGGFFAYDGFANIDNGYREYLRGELSQPLTVGKTYCVKFFVSLADQALEASNGIAAYFSPTIVTGPDAFPLPFTPQIQVGQIINDKTNWVEVSGNFTATAAHEYIVIGNFFGQGQTQSAVAVPGQGGGGFGVLPIPGSYYFVDDVSVEEVIPTSTLTINATDTLLCQGESATLTVSGGSGYTWSTGETTESITVTPNATTTYSVSLGSECNSANAAQTITVINCNAVNINLGISADTICVGECVDLTLSLQSGIEPITYNWNINGLNGGGTQSFCPDTVGAQTITVIATDANNTLDTATVNVFVKASCQLVIPNVFTPDGKGLNEAWVIANLPANSTVVIFNRWGTQVFESPNYQNNWTADKNSAGVYFYVLRLPDGSNKTGTVTVVK